MVGSHPFPLHPPLPMKRLFSLLCFLGALLASSGLSLGLTIPASEDTAGAAQITTTASGASSLSVDAISKAYLYFNLNDIPTTAVVRWAKLRLFLPTVVKNGSGLSVYRVTGAWDEAKGSASPAIETKAVATIAADQLGSKRFVTADVTGVVQRWISGGTVNEGFAIGATPAPTTASLTLTSKEGAISGLPAELDIDFAPEASAIEVEQLSPVFKDLVLSLAKPVVKVPPAISTGGFVSATVEAPVRMSHQWYKNGVPVSGGTGTSLPLAGLGSGTYMLKSTNDFAATTSAPVVFNLSTYVPTVLKQPSVLVDGALSVSGTVGTGTFGVQWYKDGVEVAGGTGKSTFIPLFAGLSSGTYTVKLSNSFGSVVSRPVKFDRAKLRMVGVLGGTLPKESELSGQVVGDFCIGKTEVTWGDWKTVREWAVNNGYSDLAGVGAGAGDNYPVTDVSWYDVVKWCNARSQKEGKTPVYQVNGETYKTGQSAPSVNTTASGYRLPTEAEWEWAARGGRQTHGYTYSGSNDLNAVGWYSNNSDSVTHEVGKKAANELGISDMSGNVWEWCWDLKSGYASRRFRGGSWNYGSNYACATAHGDADSFLRYNFLGFRLACSSGQ